MTYAEKLKLPAWQMKRLEIFKRDNCTCVSCGRNDPKVSLHVHHLKYIQGFEPWDYDNRYLVTYCEYCHNAEHLIGETLRGFFMDSIDAKAIYFKPMAQLCTLIDRWPEFHSLLKAFLIDCMLKYLKSIDCKNEEPSISMVS